MALACAKPDAGTSSGPRLTVRWTGADTAAFGASATAERCDTLHLIEIRAISGDTGLGLALYDSGTVRPGSYPIRLPASADRAAPAAALAVRWFSKTAVQGYQGESGNVTLRRAANGDLSGTFTAKARVDQLERTPRPRRVVRWPPGQAGRARVRAAAARLHRIAAGLHGVARRLHGLAPGDSTARVD